MKFLKLLILIPVIVVSQKSVNYEDIQEKNAKYDTYITKEGNKISLGSIITIGTPSSNEGFRYITQNGQRTADFLANKKVEITKIRTYKNRFSGKVYIEFKGFGLVPVSIDYETALKTGEIENPLLE